MATSVRSKTGNKALFEHHIMPLDTNYLKTGYGATSRDILAGSGLKSGGYRVIQLLRARRNDQKWSIGHNAVVLAQLPQELVKTTTANILHSIVSNEYLTLGATQRYCSVR